MDKFWRSYTLPVQDEILELEEINPAEAFRRQADAINLAGPLYAELEHLRSRYTRVFKILKELRDRILSQNMPVPSGSTRTNELVDAFIYSCAKDFVMPTGIKRDVSEDLFKLARKKLDLEFQITKAEGRLRALELMADKCDRIMNWAKHEARLELRT